MPNNNEPTDLVDIAVPTPEELDRIFAERPLTATSPGRNRAVPTTFEEWMNTPVEQTETLRVSDNPVYRDYIEQVLRNADAIAGGNTAATRPQTTAQQEEIQRAWVNTGFRGEPIPEGLDHTFAARREPVTPETTLTTEAWDTEFIPHQDTNTEVRYCVWSIRDDGDRRPLCRLNNRSDAVEIRNDLTRSNPHNQYKVVKETTHKPVIPEEQSTLAATQRILNHRFEEAPGITYPGVWFDTANGVTNTPPATP